MPGRVFRPYEDPDKPGRKDVNGVEWWACDPYPTWFRWEGGELFTNHARFPSDPQIELEKAIKAEQVAKEALAIARQRVEVARAALAEVSA